MRKDQLVALLRSPAHSGVYHLPGSGGGPLEKAAIAAGIEFAGCDFEENDDLAGALRLLAEALALPEYFGGNLDALHDCLTDLSWRDNPATVLLITGCDELRDAEPDSFDSLIDVFTAVADFWRGQSVPFWVFIDLRADGLANLPTLAVTQ